MIQVYGASDDLIEVTGTISEEFNHYSDDNPALLVFSEGTVLQMRYDTEGIWRITPVARGKARTTHVVCIPDGADDEYSDTFYLFDEELDEPIKWIVLGTHLVRRPRG